MFPKQIKTSKELGEIIRVVRKSQKLTQFELAGSLMFGNRLISEIENGKSTTQIEKVLKRLDGLGIDIVLTKRGEN